MKVKAFGSRNLCLLTLAVGLGISSSAARSYDDHDNSSASSQRQEKVKKMPRMAPDRKAKKNDVDGALTEEEKARATEEQRRRQSQLHEYDLSTGKSKRSAPEKDAEINNNPNAPDKDKRSVTKDNPYKVTNKITPD